MKLLQKQEVETSNSFGVLNNIDCEDDNTNSGEDCSIKEKGDVQNVQEDISVQRGKQLDSGCRENISQGVNSEEKMARQNKQIMQINQNVNVQEIISCNKGIMKPQKMINASSNFMTSRLENYRQMIIKKREQQIIYTRFMNKILQLCWLLLN